MNPGAESGADGSARAQDLANELPVGSAVESGTQTAVESDVESDKPAAPAADWSRQLAVLQDLDQRPLADHAEVFQALHTELQAALADIDGA